MSDYGYGIRGRKLRKRHICLIALYGSILLALIVVGLIWDRSEQQESFGSMEGRFRSDISMTVGNETVYYRENEITNYLLIGIDREAMDSASSQNGGQADFIMVLSIDRRNRAVTPVMIDRDTMTPVTTYGIFGNAAGERTMQICLAQAYSGIDASGSDNTARAVSKLLWGVEIDRCLVMDMTGIDLLNDAVGGVTVTLRDDLTSLDPSLEKGATVCLKGEIAEHFVRGRMTVGDGTNAARMERQRTYIEALIEKIGDGIKNDEAFLDEVFKVLSGHMVSDVSTNVILSEANAYSGYEWQPMKALPGTHSVGEDGFTEFRLDEAAASEMVAEIWFA